MARPNRPSRNGGPRAGLGRPPGSKNKAPREIAALAQEYGEEAIERLVAIMRDSNARQTDQIAAIAHLLDRGYGRPQQPVDLNLSGNFDEYTDAELTAMLRRSRGGNGNGSGRRPY